MGTSAYTAIASQTLASSASSVTFSSIPGDYRDLVLVCSITPSTANYFYLRFNSDSGSNYGVVNMGGDGGVTNSFATTTTQVGLNFLQSSATTEPNISQTQIMDYAQTDKHKSVLVRNGASSKATEARAARWANTSAITTLGITTSTGNFNAGSTFSLFGISA